jgi:hypothetical protein
MTTSNEAKPIPNFPNWSITQDGKVFNTKGKKTAEVTPNRRGEVWLTSPTDHRQVAVVTLVSEVWPVQEELVIPDVTTRIELDEPEDEEFHHSDDPEIEE